MTIRNSNSTQQSKSYLDLNASVCGLLQRIREVSVSSKPGRKGRAYMACTIKAFHGDARNPNFTYIDLTIPAAEALQFVEMQKQNVDEKGNPRKEVFVNAWIGDIRADSYERNNRTSGQRETAATIKGRLLKIEQTSRKDASPDGKFSLQVRGLAYLNQLFAPNSSKTTWLAGLSAMHGDFNEVEYTPFRLSADAKEEVGEVLAAFQPVFDANRELESERKKVIVAFKAANILGNIYQRSAREGDAGPVAEAQIVGDLIDITRIKVGDEVVYRVTRVGEGDEMHLEVDTNLPGLLKTGTND